MFRSSKLFAEKVIKEGEEQYAPLLYFMLFISF
jgi:hypothetical protein